MEDRISIQELDHLQLSFGSSSYILHSLSRAFFVFVWTVVSSGSGPKSRFDMTVYDNCGGMKYLYSDDSDCMSRFFHLQVES